MHTSVEEFGVFVLGMSLRVKASDTLSRNRKDSPECAIEPHTTGTQLTEVQKHGS